jgi:hypothetical protein
MGSAERLISCSFYTSTKLLLPIHRSCPMSLWLAVLRIVLGLLVLLLEIKFTIVTLLEVAGT